MLDAGCSILGARRSTFDMLGSLGSLGASKGGPPPNTVRDAAELSCPRTGFHWAGEGAPQLPIRHQAEPAAATRIPRKSSARPTSGKDFRGIDRKRTRLN